MYLVAVVVSADLISATVNLFGFFFAHSNIRRKINRVERTVLQEFRNVRQQRGSVEEWELEVRLE
ncbi:hypothetical protein T10_12113 [Trichinella papuae]|uniref:Uncharacterized protein n=1 Tax=Trichinella papuae TaxID=268474 RepID=A0A0V1MPD9_9BILA|nr:hypothetical protein T10_12113 [Trichinella papuae]